MSERDMFMNVQDIVDEALREEGCMQVTQNGQKYIRTPEGVYWHGIFYSPLNKVSGYRQVAEFWDAEGSLVDFILTTEFEEVFEKYKQVYPNTHIQLVRPFPDMTVLCDEDGFSKELLPNKKWFDISAERDNGYSFVGPICIWY